MHQSECQRLEHFAFGETLWFDIPRSTKDHLRGNYNIYIYTYTANGGETQEQIVGHKSVKSWHSRELSYPQCTWNLKRPFTKGGPSACHFSSRSIHTKLLFGKPPFVNGCFGFQVPITCPTLGSGRTRPTFRTRRKGSNETCPARDGPIFLCGKCTGG